MPNAESITPDAANNARFCLGTVKLGVPNYGFSSPSSAQPLPPATFLAQVEELGIHRLDSSPRYGNSEQILGAYLKQRPTEQPALWISSKIDQLTPNNKQTPAQMLASVQQSLQRLHRQQLDLCYLHQNELAIISDPAVHAGIALLKEQRLIDKIGVSLYSHEECHYAIACGLYDVIQIPISIFDLGFYNRFVLPNGAGTIRFAARSLLLQGILANRQEITTRIRQGEEILAYLRQMDHLAEQWQMGTTEMAVRFAFSLSAVDHLLIGTLSLANLRAILQWIRHPLSTEQIATISHFAAQAKIWSNPRNW
ncbi:aldo/keto reductase [Candidatus Magnetaquicoccus inordinatus]|uniref:aldo/keto reductase n=1 Tax=Candidatus Magnetaquicoccus inordinatus TaxID=2496818 RepID=UPI00187D53CB|nr:aldo/keto reductase [Candidatus Magnetaquicoccus inordinatus]